MYGAGTGGVVLLTSDLSEFRRGAQIDYSYGSFGLNNFHANLRGGSEDIHHSINYQYQNSDGYRNQSQLERKVLSWDGEARVGDKGMLRAHFIQGDLYYQTPGALTQAEYDANPKSARPGVGTIPGAEEAQAAITQKLFLAGLNYTLKWNHHWQNSTSLYGAYSRLVNPTIRNYERRIEPHFGSRNVIQYTGNLDKTKITLTGGAEMQQGFGASKVYNNNLGAPGILQTDDEINTKQFILFAQARFEFKNWIITGGTSLNLLEVELQRFSALQSLQKKKYNNELAPRLSVLRKVAPSISVYGSVAKGFSPPTNAELLPSTGVISTGLEAEHGINTEAGLKGNLFNGKLYFDINSFYFRLKNTIAQRRDISGADYFVNAGGTKQYGVETYLSHRLADNSSLIFNSVKIWGSHTWHNFHYSNFQKVTDDTADYSGKRLPSVPPNFMATGLDAVTKNGAIC